jgi:hypothetical protein
MLYIASDQPLPTIPWREEEPAFNVRTLEEWGAGQGVLRNLRKPHVYYVGSDQGCSCGFQGRFAQAVDQRRKLRDYLARAVAHSGTIELYSCWVGDEGTEPEETAAISVEAIADPEFVLGERLLFEIAS